jgi:hypothetical protein
LFLAKSPEHEIRRVPVFRRWADSDPQARHICASQLPDDVRQPIIATASPARAHSQLAQRKVEIIADDEQILSIQFKKINYLAYRSPASVVKQLWSQQ